uniref:Exostosin GT47 domain-containing protein n=1 Tax=viral metagenome TaxID=1070528 RepID=A0A6C0K1I9_9ZZZZ
MGRLQQMRKVRAEVANTEPWKKIKAVPRTGLEEMFVTGEKIQSICTVYLTNSNSIPNPYFGNEPSKFMNVSFIPTPSYDNPRLVFCFTHCIPDLALRIHLFQNDFVLVSHNSDHEIHENETSRKILQCSRLLHWYSQNVCMEHPRLSVVPIGLANSQWSHGNTAPFLPLLHNPPQKTRQIYFNFGIGTNPSKRQPCHDILRSQKNLEWLPHIDPTANLKRLAESEFCICPEGNGVDTHRLWEALYLQVVPIVLRTPFTEALQRQFPMMPIVMLDRWEELDPEALDVSMYEFDSFLPIIDVLEIQRSMIEN